MKASRIATPAGDELAEISRALIERRSIAFVDLGLEPSALERAALRARLAALDEIHALAVAIRKRGGGAAPAPAIAFLKRAGETIAWVIFAGIISRLVF
jgi:hypothetical protein